MAPRLNMFENKIGAAFAKRFASASLVIGQSPLPMPVAEEGTRLADAHHGVSDQTWAELRKHYDDDQVVALVCLVAMINAANRLGVIMHQRAVPTSPACSPA